MLHRDCIFYKYRGVPNWRDIQGSNLDNNFCSFSCVSYEEEILQASIIWIDPIKVREKIITSERKIMKFYVFKKNNLICLFGGSESQMAYTISKILTLFPITLEKVNIFDSFKKNFLESKPYKNFCLTSVDIVKPASGFDNSTYLNIPLADIRIGKIENYINSSDTISLLIFFQEKQIYFSVDIYSVVSFFDTDEFDFILDACKGIVVDIV
jgi:hypothetical protein